jgi:hypothetical protein
MEVICQVHAPSTLLPGKEPLYPLEGREEKNIFCRESNPSSSAIQPVAPSLYRMSYPSS